MPGIKEKRILVTSMSMSMAHVVRPLEVAKVLRDMGYRVIFSGSGKAIKLAHQAGFEHRYLPDWHMSEIIASLKSGSKDFHTAEEIERWVQAELDLYQDVQPLAVLDDARITSHISCSISGIPRISIHNAYVNPRAIQGIMDPSLEAPPSLVDALDVDSYNKVRVAHGLPSVNSLFDMFEADLILLCDVPEYAPMHTVRRNYHYVGPLVWGRDLSKPEWLSDLEPDRPTIYYTMGSTGPPQAFRAAIEIFAETEFQVLMTLGSLVEERDLQPIPPRFFVASYASGDTLAKRSDIIVCHGGNGTAYQALHSGNPIVSWPGLKDQCWNARRLSDLGVGVSIKGPDQMMSAVQEVLADPKYREKAEYFKKVLSIYDGPQNAAILTHNFLKTLKDK
jgi:MGT family glycosyltransferase